MSSTCEGLNTSDCRRSSEIIICFRVLSIICFRVLHSPSTLPFSRDPLFRALARASTRASWILVRVPPRVSFRASPSRIINDELLAGTESPRVLPSLPPSLSLHPSLYEGHERVGYLFDQLLLRGFRSEHPHRGELTTSFEREPSLRGLSLPSLPRSPSTLPFTRDTSELDTCSSNYLTGFRSEHPHRG